ncbi:hypothetical protein C0J52_01979 [Blattella germanica]|nr:hypothetical protein C0J52_01979 [Blattella germanica]
MMSEDESRHQQEYHHLLQSLKGTVEGLLISQVSNGDPDLWIFIQGLSWLNPTLAVSPTFLVELEENIPQIPEQEKGKAWVWLYRSLQGHTLSQKLSWLLSDREHLHSCFEKWGYLCQEKYGEATLICLRAVEQNQPSLLTEIDPCLTFHKTHRRCSSFPEAEYNLRRGGRNRNSHVKLLKQTSEGSQQPAGNETEAAAAANIPATKSSAGAENTSKLEECTVKIKVQPEENPVLVQSLTEEIPVESATEVSEDLITAEIVRDLKPWSSLPNLTDSRLAYGSQNRGTASESSELTQSCSVPNRSSRLGHLRSGSQTLPSSPAKFSRAASQRKSFSPESSKGKYSGTHSFKLSPSVLEVDYSIHSDTPVSASENKTFILPKLIKDSNQTPLKTITKGAILKKQAKSKDTTLKAVIHKRTASNCTEVSSGSSDTLNPETNKSSNESQQSAVKVRIQNDKPNVRPSDLRLTVRAWDKADSSGTEQRTSMSGSSSRGHDAKPKRKKAIIIGSAPEYAGEWLNDEQVTPRNNHMKLHKKSFIESGGGSVLPMSTGFFPRPMEGQSLTSFLSSGQFSRPSAELDRENAHFSVSEAMIAAIEQVKCKRQLRVAEETGDVCDETTTTDQSVSPLSSSPGTPSESISTDDVDDLEVDEVKNLAQLKNAGLSVSMASLYSEADLSKHPPLRTGIDAVLTESVVSAEGVALSLLKLFGEKHLPRASELQWLLLPLPTSWPVSPDEAEDLDMRQATPLRGTIEWAPPRPQVIFTPHPAPVRRVLMVKQNYRCAGCGMKVAPEYANKYRYCEYLGRYFCTGCHTNQLALIPGKVLTKWDFTRYPVSSFSYRLLDEMLMDPLFRIGDHSPALYRKARHLERTRQLRIQLFYLKDFVLTCRFSDHLQEAFKKEQVYMLTELETYSMNDLVQVKSGELSTRLRELLSSSSQHVAECQLCQARGFVCEICRSQEVIFPWQLSKVARCNNCGACFHIACWTPSPCRRCNRLKERRQSREKQEEADIQAM